MKKHLTLNISSKKIFSLFLFSLIFINIASFLPYLFDHHISGGQLTKQAHTAMMIQNISKGLFSGLFPFRTFLEIYHTDPMPWACEFPLYSYLCASLSFITGISSIGCAKFIGLFTYIFFLFSIYKLTPLISSGVSNISQEENFVKNGNSFSDPQHLTLEKCLFFILLTSLIPVFKTYALQVMPTMSMLCSLSWGLYFSLKKRWAYSYLCFLIACLFKYYGIFFVIGLEAFYFIRSPSRINFIKSIFMLSSCIPSAIYIIYAILSGISNPITDYGLLGHAGHLSSSSRLLSLRFYSRIFTWVFIKNSTPLIPLSFFLCFFLNLKRKKNSIKLSFFLSLFVSQVLFILIFANGHYIHDYYSIQFSFIFLISLIGLNFYEGIKDKIYFKLLFLIIFTILSFRQTYSSLRPQNYLTQYGNMLQKYIPQNKRILIIGNRATEVPALAAERISYILSAYDLDKKYVRENFKRLIVNKKISYIFIYNDLNFQDIVHWNNTITSLLSSYQVHYKKVNGKKESSQEILYKLSI